MLKTLCGNEGLKENLCAALRAKRLPHGVLLCAEPGAGGNYAARCLAADYLYPEGGEGARLVLQGACPEYLVLQGEGASGDIKIDRVREVREAIYHTSLSAEGRCVHVRGAHHLNGASANALLKVLEEPPEGVLFVLTAPSEAAVLPTIRSRCAVYAVCPVSAKACEAFLQKRFPGAPRKTVQELSVLLGGKIGSAQRCLQDAQALRRFEDAKRLCTEAAARRTYAVLCLLAQYEKDRAGARAFLADARQVCAAALDGAFAGVAPRDAARLLPQLAKADARLAANGNQKLVLIGLGAQV